MFLIIGWVMLNIELRLVLMMLCYCLVCMWWKVVLWVMLVLLMRIFIGFSVVLIDCIIVLAVFGLEMLLWKSVML